MLRVAAEPWQCAETAGAVADVHSKKTDSLLDRRTAYECHKQCQRTSREHINRCCPDAIIDTGIVLLNPKVSVENLQVL